MRPRTRLLRAIVVLLALTPVSPAQADIAPPPTRPAHWQEQPSPMPEPPPEKDPLTPTPALFAVVALMGLVTLAWPRASRARAA